MHRFPLYALITCILIGLPSVGFSAAFQDLDFEAATIAPAPANPVPGNIPPAYAISSDAAFPGWTVKLGDTVSNTIWNGISPLDEVSVTLVHHTTEFPGYPIDGTYSVQMYSLLSTNSAGQTIYNGTCSLSQTGLVPAGTQSIRLQVAGRFSLNSATVNPIVTLDGTPINIQVLSTANGVTMLGGDVSAFAGKTANLALLCQSAIPVANNLSENLYTLDDIQFSPLAVPEPSAIWLVTLGCIMVATCWLRRNVALMRR